MEKANNLLYSDTAVLAYVGDAVYEVAVRKHVFDAGVIKAQKLHLSAVKYVRAEAQAAALKKMMDELSEDETTLVKRARNKKITSKPQNADPVIYKWATAFEALIGYLYLLQNTGRMIDIIEKTIRFIESDECPGSERRNRREE